MALTPIDFIITEEDVVDDTQEQLEELAIETSRTWQIDLVNGRIGKLINNEEAIKQYIRKALMTYRSRFLIYDDYYGEQITDLFGQDVTRALMQVEVPRLIREALIFDERIADVPIIDVTQLNSDSIVCEVTVELVDGEFVSEEVEL